MCSRPATPCWSSRTASSASASRRSPRGLPVELDRLRGPVGRGAGSRCDRGARQGEALSRGRRASTTKARPASSPISRRSARCCATPRRCWWSTRVSGVGGVEMRMDEWGVDVVVTASQKSLMCPPGLAIAAVSEKAMRVIDAAHGIPRFFFDFRRAKTSLDKGETPFTPPVSLIVGLREALAMINEEGLPAVLRAPRAPVGGAARRLRGARLSDVSGRAAVLGDRHGRRRPRRARRIGDRAPHVRALPHRDRRPAHQAAQPRHPHRHDGMRRAGGHPRRPALSRMHAARAWPRACAGRRRAGRRGDAGG